MGEKKISVIIPVYNAEWSIVSALDSIKNQTLKDIEIICIDDGSTDNSLNIIQREAQQDSRIIALTQKNQGAGPARNMGLRYATGEYIAFMDADDRYPAENTLERLFGEIESSQQKIAGGYVVFDKGEGIEVDESNPIVRLQDRYPNGGVVQYKELQFDYHFYAFIYKRQFLVDNGIAFPKYRRYEDPPFFVQAMATAGSFQYLPIPTYVYLVGHQDVVWHEAVCEGVLRGLNDVLLLSQKYDLQALHCEAYKKLTSQYYQHFLPFIYEKNIAVCSCLWRAIWDVNVDWLADFSDEPRKKIILQLKTAVADMMNDLVCRGNSLSDAAAAIKERFVQNGILDEEMIQELLLNCQENWERVFDRSSKDSVRVSVIIPVHNAEEYLKACLESLLCQTEADFEAICIDDGSDDNSAFILKQFALSDKRIKPYFRSNCGAGPARNFGIFQACGEYVFFMDADDIAADTLLEKTYTAAKKREADIVIFDIFTYNTITKESVPQKYCFRRENIPLNKTAFNIFDVPNSIFQISNPAPWTKLIRKKFILDHNIQYQNLQNTNDAFFAHVCMAMAEKIAFVDERLYFYRIGMEKNIQSNKENHPDCIVDAFLAIYNRLKDEGRFYLCEKSWIKEFMSVICWTLNTLTTPSAYQKLYDRLHTDDVEKTGIFSHPEQYYRDVDHYPFIKKFFNTSLKYSSEEQRNSHYIVKNNITKTPDVSVVISVYNLEEYIRDCINSVRNQTLRNIEIICIDDHSSDHSVEIMKELADVDNRISVITQLNSGLSAVRNIGIKEAKGRYIHFLDGDDCLNRDALMTLIKNMDRQSLDVAFFEGRTVYENEALKSEKGHFDNYYTYRCNYDIETGLTLFTKLMNNYEFKPSACLQIARTAFLKDNNIGFYEGITHEDELYTLSVLSKAERSTVIHAKCYIRMVRSNSIMTSPASVESARGYLITYVKSFNIVEDTNCTSRQLEAIEKRQRSIVDEFLNCYNKLSANEQSWLYALCSPVVKCKLKMLLELYGRRGVKTSQEVNTTVRRLNDHDVALRYAQEELAVDRNRLNDHDTALGYLQTESAVDQGRLNDHDTALGYLQADMDAVRAAIQQMQGSTSWKLGRALTWIPRKLIARFKHS